MSTVLYTIPLHHHVACSVSAKFTGFVDTMLLAVHTQFDRMLLICGINSRSPLLFHKDKFRQSSRFRGAGRRGPGRILGLVS